MFTVNEMRLLVCALPSFSEIPFNQHDVTVITHVTHVLLYPLYGGYTGCIANTTLPNGLSLDANTCIIEGIVVMPGTWVLSISMEDSTLVSKPIVIRSSFCDGTVLLVDRTYGSNSLTETYAVMEKNTRTVLFSEAAYTDQDPTNVKRKAACVRNGSYLLRMADDKLFWDCESSLQLSILTADGGITMPIADTRYDSNVGEAMEIPFQVAVLISHGSKWDVKSYEPTEREDPPGEVYRFVFEKTFLVDSFRLYHSMRVYVRYRCGIKIFVNRREVYRHNTDGILDPSKMSYTRCYHTLRYRIFSFPIVTLTKEGQYSNLIYSGANTITVYSAGDYDHSSEFDMVLFGNSFPNRSVVTDALISVEPQMPYKDHPFHTCSSSQFYYMGTPNNTFTISFYQGRREWISAFVITSTKEYSIRPTEITLEVKNPEDSNWIQVTRVVNMIWWKNGLAKVIYVDLKKPYYQYRFRNINTSIANNTEWRIQSLDLIQSSLTSQYLCLDYPPLSFLFNDYPDTVLFPLSPLYSNFVLETELPPGMWIDGATGVIGGRPPTPRFVYIYLTASLLSSVVTPVGVTISIMGCDYPHNYVFLNLYPPRFHSDISIKLEDDSELLWELKSFPYTEDDVTLFFCLLPTEYRLTIDNSNETAWNYPSSFSVAVTSQDNIVLQDYIRISRLNTVYLFSNINPILDCNLFQLLSGTHKRWTPQASTSSPMMACSPIVIPYGNGTLYVHYVITVPNILLYHVVTIRIRSSYCYTLSFNGRKVGKFGLNANSTLCVSANRSVYNTVHIPLIEAGGFTGSNDLILMLLPPRSNPALMIKANGYFTINQQAEFHNVVSAIGTQSTGILAPSVLFDGNLLTSTYINPLTLNVLEFSINNKEGQPFTTISVYVSQDLGHIRVSLLGNPSKDTLQYHPHFNDGMEAIIFYPSLCYSQYRYIIPVAQGLWRMQSLRLSIYSFQTPAVLAHISEVTLGYEADSRTLICPALGGYPAVKEGSFSPGPCPANYSGTATRLCSGGLLSDIKLTGCQMIPPLNLRYAVDAFVFSEHIFNSTGVPQFDFIVQSYEIISGTLPQGLKLDAETGEISGEPSACGKYQVTIRGKNQQGSTDTSISIHVCLSMCEASGFDSSREIGTEVWMLCSSSVGGIGFVQRRCIYSDRFVWITSASYCVQRSFVIVTCGVVVCVLFIAVGTRYAHRRRVQNVVKLSKVLLKRTAGMV